MYVSLWPGMDLCVDDLMISITTLSLLLLDDPALKIKQEI